MKRRMRHGTGPGGPVQWFAYGPLEFNVNRALALAANAGKYRPEPRWPEPQWVGPYIEIDPRHVEEADLGRPVLFATVITDGQPWPLLIDGNHRVLKALRHRVQVQTVQLDLGDTLKVVRGPAALLEHMRRHGERLGLLPGGRSFTLSDSR
jgi:hypothetical protein